MCEGFVVLLAVCVCCLMFLVCCNSIVSLNLKLKFILITIICVLFILSYFACWFVLRLFGGNILG